MNKNNKITNLDDAEFISFLYAERDRENNLSQYQGWNNWALIGAFMTIVCAGYAILKDANILNWNDVFYYSTGIISYFLIYHSWSRAFKRERGVDFYKVRTLSEIAPYVQIVFVFICAIASAIIIPLTEGFNAVFWWWIAVLIVFVIAIILIIVFRNKIIPACYHELFLPWVWGNMVLAGFMGVVLANVGYKSFCMATNGVYSDEFALAACVAGCFIIIFVFVTINTNNKSVRRFDAIIDDYIYSNVSKEETYRKITINRMGYGVMDACTKEFEQINRLMSKHDEDEREVEKMKAIIDAGAYTIEQLHQISLSAKAILNKEKRILELTKQLNGKLKEIIIAVPIYKNIPELNYIINTNISNGEKIDSLSTELQDLLERIPL